MWCSWHPDRCLKVPQRGRNNITNHILRLLRSGKVSNEQRKSTIVQICKKKDIFKLLWTIMMLNLCLIWSNIEKAWYNINLVTFKGWQRSSLGICFKNLQQRLHFRRKIDINLWERKMDFHIIFINLEKAYDRISRKVL